MLLGLDWAAYWDQAYKDYMGCSHKPAFNSNYYIPFKLMIDTGLRVTDIDKQFLQKNSFIHVILFE